MVAVDRVSGADQVLTLTDHALDLAKSRGRDRAVGVLPLGLAAESGPRPAGWWRQPPGFTARDWNMENERGCP